MNMKDTRNLVWDLPPECVFVHRLNDNYRFYCRTHLTVAQLPNITNIGRNSTFFKHKVYIF